MIRVAAVVRCFDFVFLESTGWVRVCSVHRVELGFRLSFVESFPEFRVSISEFLESMLLLFCFASSIVFNVVNFAAYLL